MLLPHNPLFPHFLISPIGWAGSARSFSLLKQQQQRILLQCLLYFFFFFLSLSLSLSLFFSLHPTFLPLSLSVHWSLSQARRRCKILRSFPSLVSIPSRSVTYTKSKISSSILPTSCSILYWYIHILMRAVQLGSTTSAERWTIFWVFYPSSTNSSPLSKTIYSYRSSLVHALINERSRLKQITQCTWIFSSRSKSPAPQSKLLGSKAVRMELSCTRAISDWLV